MNIRSIFRALVCATVMLTAGSVWAHERQPFTPQGWCSVRRESVALQKSASPGKKVLLHLRHGTLLPWLDSKEKADGGWLRVRAVDPAKLTPHLGWVRTDQVELHSKSKFPEDKELLKPLGGIYLEDFTTSHIEVTRFLVRRVGQEPLLLCWLGAPIMPTSRLQVFRHTGASFKPGPFLEFSFSLMQAGIVGMEVRDLIKEGEDLIVTREPFQLGPQNSGLNMVIRRITDQGFEVLWQAPLELRNFSYFPPEIQPLEPPGRNIGAPGTITTGTVELPRAGGKREVVWKGKVEFFVYGREEPVESLPFEKACPWDGTRFTPLH